MNNECGFYSQITCNISVNVKAKCTNKLTTEMKISERRFCRYVLDAIDDCLAFTHALYWFPSFRVPCVFKYIFFVTFLLVHFSFCCYFHVNLQKYIFCSKDLELCLCLVCGFLFSFRIIFIDWIYVPNYIFFFTQLLQISFIFSKPWPTMLQLQLWLRVSSLLSVFGMELDFLWGFHCFLQALMWDRCHRFGFLLIAETLCRKFSLLFRSKTSFLILTLAALEENAIFSHEYKTVII